MGKVITLGSIAIDTFEGVKTIHSDSAKDTYSSFESPLGTYYQIPAGKIFHVGGALYSGDAVKTTICLGYGDDTVNDSVTPPTNNIELIHQIPVEVADRFYDVKFYIYVPAGKYPYIHCTDGAGSMLLLGVNEET